MNRKAHVIVARRLGDVPVLSWTKIHCVTSRNNDSSTTFGPTTTLQSTHLALAPNTAGITVNVSDTSGN
jgi:hypothetical protein